MYLPWLQIQDVRYSCRLGDVLNDNFCRLFREMMRKYCQISKTGARLPYSLPYPGMSTSKIKTQILATDPTPADSRFFQEMLYQHRTENSNYHRCHLPFKSINSVLMPPSHSRIANINTNESHSHYFKPIGKSVVADNEPKFAFDQCERNFKGISFDGFQHWNIPRRVFLLVLYSSANKRDQRFFIYSSSFNSCIFTNTRNHYLLGNENVNHND